MSDRLELALWRRRRVRAVRQSQVTECGLACLAMVAGYYGLEMDMASLRRRFSPSARGASLKALIEIADELGLTARAVRAPLSKLGKLALPAVLHWDLNHFVVLERVKGGRALIHDPDGNSGYMRLEDVSDHFTGVALELRPGLNFEVDDQKQKLQLSQLWTNMRGLRTALVQVVMLSVLMQIFSIAAPFYMQVAVDAVLPAQDRGLLAVLALGFALLAFINAGATLLRAFVLLSAGTAVSYGIAVNVARRLFRLPVAWFETRSVGDILSRFQSIGPLRQFMTEGAVATVLDGFMVLLTLGVMLFYSIALTSIAVAAFACYALLRAAVFSLQKRFQQEAIIAGGKEQSLMIESLRGIVTLRLFNREMERHAQWQSRLTDSSNAQISLSRVNAWQAMASTLILGLETIASSWLAITLVLDSAFSIGMVFAFTAYKLQFLQRASSIVDQAASFAMLKLHLERISDVALTEPDRCFDTKSDIRADMKGRIELADVSFRYSPSDPFVLRHLHLIIEPGEHVAITGPSGSGKSTLIKILLGLIEPSEGQVLVDGVQLQRFGIKNFHEQVGAVLQEDHLFAGSLADNIALFDEAPDFEWIREAARMAGLDEDILGMPMGYESLVGDMGSSLSGGQRQRLLLARALYRRPKLLVMDEGTSHLDPNREQSVNAEIAKLGVTRIVVAHRIETILASTRILSLSIEGITEITDQLKAMERHLRRPTDIKPPL